MRGPAVYPLRSPSRWTTISVAGSTALTQAEQFVKVNSLSSVTLDLPTSIGLLGKFYYVKNINSGVVTVDASSTQTIDGALTVTLNQNDSLLIVSDGSNWLKILGPGSSSPLYTGNTLWVDAVNGNNSTAVRGRSDRPWADPWNAVSTAVSGDVIKIRSGSYTSPSGLTNLYKSGVTYEAEGAVTLILDQGGTLFDTTTYSGSPFVIKGKPNITGAIANGKAFKFIANVQGSLDLGIVYTTGYYASDGFIEFGDCSNLLIEANYILGDAGILIGVSGTPSAILKSRSFIKTSGYFTIQTTSATSSSDLTVSAEISIGNASETQTIIEQHDGTLTIITPKIVSSTDDAMNVINCAGGKLVLDVKTIQSGSTTESIINKSGGTLVLINTYLIGVAGPAAAIEAPTAQNVNIKGTAGSNYGTDSPTNITFVGGMYSISSDFV